MASKKQFNFVITEPADSPTNCVKIIVIKLSQRTRFSHNFPSRWFHFLISTVSTVIQTKMRDEFAILGRVPAPTEQSRGDIKYSTELNRWFLTPIGIWPTRSDAHIIEKILSELLIFLSCFLICFLLVPCGLHTFIKEQDPKLKMKMIGPLSFCLMAITKYLFLVARRREIRHCIGHIDVDWRRVAYLDDREIMLANAKIGRFIAWLCAAFMYGGGFFYHTIMPFSAGSFVTPDNITIRPLTYTVYDPLFSAQTTPAYEIVFTIQWFSGFVNYSVTIGACSL
nr:odorant receptor 29 [Psyttalia incisi]